MYSQTEIEKGIEDLDLFKPDTKLTLLRIALRLYTDGLMAQEVIEIINEMVCAIRNEYGE